jgi:two-component system response regulator DegU
MGSDASGRSAWKVRVLVVDDARNTRSMLCGLIERRGFIVAGEAESAAGALESVQRLAPNGVLLDVRLPDGNGFEVCARLTAMHPRLAVVLTSCDPDSSFYELAEASGARGFVPKNELTRVDLSAFW